MTLAPALAFPAETSKKQALSLKKQPWTEEKFKAFMEEIDVVGRQIQSQLGAEDMRYLKRVARQSKMAEILGRALIHFGLDPVTWSAGVLFLAFHKQIDTIQIGHSALHGCWDSFPEAKKFHSTTHRWNTPIEEESWRHGHNVLHHFFTNIVGKDPDLNFGLLRLSPDTPWSFHHLFQITQFFLTAPLFTWLLNLYFTGFPDLLHRPGAKGYAQVLPDRNWKTLVSAGRRSLKKLVPYFAYNYVLWPALAGPFAPKVVLGNFIADLLRNIFSIASVYTGHFGEGMKYYDSTFKAKGKGEWMKAQIEGAQNFTTSPFLQLLSGELGYQIEHHLFPKLPPNRLRQIAPEIERICEKYGVHYEKRSWGGALWNTFGRIAKMSLPRGDQSKLGLRATKRD